MPARSGSTDCFNSSSVKEFSPYLSCNCCLVHYLSILNHDLRTSRCILSASWFLNHTIEIFFFFPSNQRHIEYFPLCTGILRIMPVSILMPSYDNIASIQRGPLESLITLNYFNSLFPEKHVLFNCSEHSFFQGFSFSDALSFSFPCLGVNKKALLPSC